MPGTLRSTPLALQVARADLAAQRAALLQERQEFEQRTAALLAGTGEVRAEASGFDAGRTAPGGAWGRL